MSGKTTALRATFTIRKKHTLLLVGAFAALALLAYSATAQSLGSVTTEPEKPASSSDPLRALLDTGFRDLYELNFKDARAQFLAYQKARPEDPMGFVAEAASYLYEQFNAKGVLTSAFFLDNDKFLNGVDGTPAENANAPFLAANERAREMAKNQLKSNPNDQQALLVLTMADGMESNYDALIIKKELAALSLMKQAEATANKLLTVDPNAQDAYLALGTSNYVIGCLSGFKRAFLWFGGVHGDRQRGIDQMQRAADHGKYLQPFAKIMLALALEREHQMDRARVLLEDLSREFPSNPIFVHELALLDHRSAVPCKTANSAFC